MAIGTVIWCIFYLIIKNLPLNWMMNGKTITPTQNIDLRNRLVSLFHGFMAFCFAAYHMFMNRTECGELNTSYQRNVIIFSNSYFLYDLICMHLEGILDVAMTIHHPLCVFGLFLPLYENMSGNFCMMAIFISEISNPPMTIRHIFRLTGRRYTKGYEAAELSFIALYVYGRIIAGIPIVMQTLTCPQNHFFLKLTCIGLML
jgi:hypothetical protein